jgi:hypothetical protein
MTNNYQDRYGIFKTNGSLQTLPRVNIPISTNDKYITYIDNFTRLDRIALKYYNDSTLGWLILYANPQVSFEFDFKNDDIIRIPFPMEQALSNYYGLIDRELKN